MSGAKVLNPMPPQAGTYDEVLALGNGDIKKGMARFIWQYQRAALLQEREWIDKQIEVLNHRWNEINRQMNEVLPQ